MDSLWGLPLPSKVDVTTPSPSEMTVATLAVHTVLTYTTVATAYTTTISGTTTSDLPPTHLVTTQQQSNFGADAYNELILSRPTGNQHNTRIAQIPISFDTNPGKILKLTGTQLVNYKPPLFAKVSPNYRCIQFIDPYICQHPQTQAPQHYPLYAPPQPTLATKALQMNRKTSSNGWSINSTLVST